MCCRGKCLYWIKKIWMRTRERKVQKKQTLKWRKIVVVVWLATVFPSQAGWCYMATVVKGEVIQKGRNVNSSHYPVSWFSHRTSICRWLLGAGRVQSGNQVYRWFLCFPLLVIYQREVGFIDMAAVDGMGPVKEAGVSIVFFFIFLSYSD